MDPWLHQDITRTRAPFAYVITRDGECLVMCSVNQYREGRRAVEQMTTTIFANFVQAERRGEDRRRHLRRPGMGAEGVVSQLHLYLVVPYNDETFKFLLTFSHKKLRILLE